MTLYSALEDLASRTLAALPSRLSRLLYLSGLRDARGRYSHWGLNLVHGEEETQRAAAQAHEQVVGEVLRTPLQELEPDAAQASRQAGTPEGVFLQEMQSRSDELMVPEMGPESHKHLSSVLLALSRLAHSKRAAIRRAS
jgi:hypothetical protein